MGEPARQCSKRQAFFAALLLGVVIFLNAAAVLPALHLLSHADHECDQPDCVVVALAHGNLDPSCAPPPPVARAASAVELPATPVVQFLAVTASRLPPGRGPPA